MKRTLLTTGILCLFSLTAIPQQMVELDLQQCYREATEKHPLAGLGQKQEKITALKNENLSTNYLPQASLNGQAQYLSDVTKVDVDPQITGMPFGTEAPEVNIDMPTPSNDQYKLYLDVQQVIWDGGATSRAQDLEQAGLEASQQEIQVQLYKVKEQVNEVYFTILIIEESQRSLQIMMDELREQEKVISSAVRNGVMLPSNLDVLRAEMMKLQQKMAELDINRRAMLDVLGVLLDRELPDSTHLTKPAETGLPVGPGQRPEHELYERQKNQLQAAENLTGVKNYPKVFAFGQAGYGKPGLNMLSEDFDTYYIVGAGVKWTFWDWNTVEREKQVLQIQRDMVDDQRNTFDQVQNMQVQKAQAEITRYREMIERDEEIIELRQKITRSAKSQFEHGVITATEYLTELNAETRARIELETHKLQLVQATYKLQIINGQ